MKEDEALRAYYDRMHAEDDDPLREKGVITMDEYEAAHAAEMEAEQARYEQRLGVHLH